MKITHFGHSCLLLDTGSARLLIDPGVWSHGFEDLSDLDAVLITHMHPDHLDTGRLAALMAANQHAVLLADPASTAEADRVGVRAREVRPGDAVEVAGTVVAAVGGKHATIHPEIEVPPNVGYVLDDGAFYHPGDSLFVPEQDIRALALPTGAPWLKVSEAVEFFRAVAPSDAVPIHDLTLSDAGRASHVQRFHDLAPEGASVRSIGTGESTEL